MPDPKNVVGGLMARYRRLRARARSRPQSFASLRSVVEDGVRALGPQLGHSNADAPQRHFQGGPRACNVDALVAAVYGAAELVAGRELHARNLCKESAERGGHHWQLRRRGQGRRMRGS